MRNFLVVVLLFAVFCCCQKHYYDDFYSLRQAAPKVSADKIKMMISILNREKFAAQKLRITNFINNNVEKASRLEQQELAFKQLSTINDMRQFMTGLYSAVKKTKVLNDKQMKEIKYTFDSLDYNLKHDISQVFPTWMERLYDHEVIARDKFPMFNTTIYKFKSGWEMRNSQLSQRLFPTTIE